MALRVARSPTTGLLFLLADTNATLIAVDANNEASSEGHRKSLMEDGSEFSVDCRPSFLRRDASSERPLGAQPQEDAGGIGSKAPTAAYACRASRLLEP